MSHARELAALAVIRSSTWPPTHRELAAQLGVSLATAHRAVRRLVELGWARAGTGRRSIAVLPAGEQALEQAEQARPATSADHRDFRNRYVFGHARDAVRCWDSHLRGLVVDRTRDCRTVTGRPPTFADVLRIGRVLSGMGLTGRQLDDVRAWARGSLATTDQRVRALVDRVALRLQTLRLVRPPRPRFTLRRSCWTDADGDTHTTGEIVEDA